MSQRNDAELASVMRKLIEDGDVAGIVMPDYTAFYFGDTRIIVTEAEQQAIEETMSLYDNTEGSAR